LFSSDGTVVTRVHIFIPKALHASATATGCYIIKSMQKLVN